MADQINLVSHERFKEGLKGVYDKTKEKISDLKLRTHVGKELDYGSFGFSSSTLSNTEFVYFDTVKNGNISLDKTDNTIILEPNKKYLIAFGIRTDGSLVLQYGLYDKTTNSKLPSNILTTQANQSGVNPAISLIETKSNTIKLCVQRIYNYGSGTIYGSNSFMSIIEVGREVLINEVEEVDKKYGVQDTPVGHIMSVMALTAPPHYLVCDGTIYNITDYHKLAEYFKDQFGSINYFGGDGTTTFAVPDMRGEFVRGYDSTNLRDPGGSTRGVGKHQDATNIPYIFSGSSIAVTGYNLSLGRLPENMDKQITNVTGYSSVGLNGQSTTGTYCKHYNARPTNVNVLFCIKYEPTYFMNYSPQYSGFDETTIFEGEANAVGTYALNDSIYEYSYLDVYATLKLKSDGSYICGMYTKVNPIDVKNNKANNVLQVTNGAGGMPWRCSFTTSETAFKINALEMPNTNYSIVIYKIVGIKAGSSSSSSTGTVTDVEINNEDITDKEITDDINEIFSEVMNK